VAICDYCGATYRGGAAVHGKLRFCTHQCRDKGRVLELLDQIPPSMIEDQIDKIRAGPCPECGSRASIDVHKSYKVYSALVWTSWRTRSHFCCQSCGRRHQAKALASSALLGWWGIPFGLLITPWQIVRNLLAMMRKADRASPDLERSVRIDLANALARSNAQT
jgi:hypothetical protein